MAMHTGVGKENNTGSITKERLWLLVGVLLSFILFLTTLQTTINGSESPYTNDTGEIQNVLPRWGTLHWTGYPQYSFIGSMLVTILRLVGIPPAAGASIVSAVWAAITVGFVILLARELYSSIETAVLGGWFLAISTSFWMDASVAEVHTMTAALTVATLYFSLRFGRDGNKRDLLWAVFCFSQGVVHQRAIVFIAPAVGLMIYPQWREIFTNIKAVFGLAILAPLTYLYLPFCVLLGVDVNWTFGQIGSVKGLLGMLLDNRADRVVEIPASLAEWVDRLGVLFKILNDDLWWPLLLVGLVGLVVVPWVRNRREAIGLASSWAPYCGLALLIWVGYVGDAVLAAKLPILPMAALGLGLALGWIDRRIEKLGRGKTYRWIGFIGLMLILIFMAVIKYPAIVSVTHDQSAEEVISTVERVTPPAEDEPTVLMALWGNDFWALAYAQAFENRLSGIRLVDHNADFNALLEEGNRLWVLSQVFYLRPISWWDEHLKVPAILSSIGPGVIQVSVDQEAGTFQDPQEKSIDLGNGIHVVSTDLEWSKDDLVLEVVWQAIEPISRDYSVAVHLVANEPPSEPGDILAQSDSVHPIEGWYPTSRWIKGQRITDHYLITVPENSTPAAIRVAMYYQDVDGSFVNSSWLTIPIVDEGTGRVM
ncbi:MAG: DUF2723 domain-containing protein [Anaerolineales bacterium]|nr:DUF2723 domain-containing protein [Anaerolineales bacterium]